MTSAHAQTGDPTAGTDSGIAGVPAARAEPSGRGAVYIVSLVLLVAARLGFLVPTMVVLPIRDGRKDRASAEETYTSLQSTTRSARWRTDGEIDDVARTRPAAGA